MGSAICFGSALGLTASFPAHYTTAVMIGNGVAGIIVGLLRIITKISLPDTAEGLQTATIIYFALAALSMAVCLVGFWYMLRVPFARHFLDERAVAADVSSGGVQPDWRLVRCCCDVLMVLVFLHDLCDNVDTVLVPTVSYLSVHLFDSSCFFIDNFVNDSLLLSGDVLNHFLRSTWLSFFILWVDDYHYSLLL